MPLLNPYLVVPLAACTVSTAIGCVILMMGIQQRANRIAGYLLLGVGYWAFCEVLWNTAGDPVTALWLNRLSAPGWIFLAPLTVSLALEVQQRRFEHFHAVVPILYAGSAVCLVLTWTTPWMVRGMVETSWGWAMVPGSVFPSWLAFTVMGLSLGLVSWIASYRSSGADVDRARGPVVAVALLGLFMVASVTDGVLPILDYQTPRVATSCFAVMGGVVLWALNRYGYSGLTPQAFSRRILHALPEGVVFTSLNGRVRTANDQMAELLGCSTQAAEGLSISAMLGLPLCNPPQEIGPVECQLTPLLGAPIPVSVSAAPVHDNQGLAMGLVVIVSDLREVAALRNRVLKSGRLAAVGQLASGMSHEINNPLSFVRANLSYLRREFEELRGPGAGTASGDDSGIPLIEWKELVDESIEGIDRATTIVSDVKSFAHAGGTAHEASDVHELIEQVLKVAGPNLGPGVRISRVYCNDVPPLCCSPQRIKQVLLNLLTNSANAMEGNGTVQVLTACDEDTLTIAIRDDGVGIPSDRLEHIFDPTVGGSSSDPGSGMGLAICQQIISDHDGEIDVESAPGRGTTVRIYLPLSQPAGQADSPAPPESEG